MSKVSLAQQIEEVEREIRKRKEVYPRQVMLRKMRQGEADELIRRMEAVLATLKWLDGNVAPGAARPADLIAALVHIRRNLEGSQPESKGADIAAVIDDVLTGIHVPVLAEIAIAAAKVLNPEHEKSPGPKPGAEA